MFSYKWLLPQLFSSAEKKCILGWCRREGAIINLRGRHLEWFSTYLPVPPDWNIPHMRYCHGGRTATALKFRTLCNSIVCIHRKKNHLLQIHVLRRETITTIHVRLYARHHFLFPFLLFSIHTAAGCVFSLPKWRTFRWIRWRKKKPIESDRHEFFHLSVLHVYNLFGIFSNSKKIWQNVHFTMWPHTTSDSRIENIHVTMSMSEILSNESITDFVSIFNSERTKSILSIRNSDSQEVSVL